MNKKVILSLVALLLLAANVDAKVKEIVKADKNYDFKSVKKFVVLPVTSEGVDFGKVDKDRVQKIEAILKKTKENLRKNMIEGSKAAKTTIPFVATANKKEPPTTILLQYNIDKFDNGNFAARMVPFAGKAKVELRVKMINAANKAVLSEFIAKGEAKGGMVAGGLDSEVLWSAVNIANADTYKYYKKLTGLDYSFWSGVTKGAKTGIKSSAEVIKEEKHEKETIKAKTKKK